MQDLAWKYDKKIKGYIGGSYLKEFGLADKRFHQSSDIHFLEDEKAENFIKFLNEGFNISIIEDIFSNCKK